MSRNVTIAIFITFLVLFLTGWFYLTGLKIDDIEDKEIIVTIPTATPSATLAPREIIREVRVNPTSTPVVPTSVPNNTTVINNPPPAPQSTSAPEPTQAPAPNPTPTPVLCLPIVGCVL